jgi:Uma2 family endonuclease
MSSTVRARAQRLHTWDDFVSLPDDDRRELIDGALVEVEAPTKWHEKLVVILGAFLQMWARTRKLHVLSSAYKVRVRHDRGAMPDLQMMKDSVYRARVNDQGLVRGKPELVVEIVSPSSRQHDRVRKVEWYAALGVPEYWIVDVDDRLVQRLVLRRKQYVLAQQAAGDEVFAPASMKGLAIPLAELWDALPKPRKRK